MKTAFTELEIKRALILESDIRWEAILKPQGQPSRLARRVGVWLFHEYLNYSKEELSTIFGIESIQSVYRILRKKNIPADEYNLRLIVRNRLERFRLQQIG